MVATANIELRGAHAKLFECRGAEVLMEGGVGTGKTWSICQYARWLAESYPGCRLLFVRQTRVSMTQSVLVTWETQVLGYGHPAIHGSASRAHRGGYIFPNGSEVVLGGMDRPETFLSSEYDVAFMFEAAECAPEGLELITTRLRYNHIPWQQLICDTNPRGEYHWLNLRAKAGRMTRLRSRHWMNPTFYELESKEWTPFAQDYLGRVAKGLTGARFQQYFKGRWTTDIGLIYPMFDPAMHVIKGRVEKLDTGQIMLWIEGRCDNDGNAKPIEIQWSIASVDWGFTVPGTMQVWGVDKEKNSYLLAEVYRKEMSSEWWADRAVEFRDEFGIRRIVCDPAEPDRIALFNDRLGTPGGREEARIAVKANNAVLSGISHVQALLAPLPDGTRGPKIYLLENALRHGREKDLDAMGKPCCLWEEALAAFWVQNEEGKPIREKPDPTCALHALDGMRYGQMWIWRKDLTMPPEMIELPEGSIGAVLNHRARLEAIAAKERE